MDRLSFTQLIVNLIDAKLALDGMGPGGGRDKAALDAEEALQEAEDKLLPELDALIG